MGLINQANTSNPDPLSNVTLEKNTRIGNKTVQPLGTPQTNLSLSSSVPSQTNNNATSGIALPTIDMTKAVDNGPTMQNVGDNELVSNQMNALLDDNSKYMQFARNSAKRTANSRGLLNSTIAAGAGEEAAIKSALPIAQQDAQTYNTTNTNNNNWENKFSENNQVHGQSMERDANNAHYQNQNTLLQGELQAGRDRVNAGYNQELERLRADSQAGLLTQEGAQRLQQLEREGEIQLDRDRFGAQATTELEQLRAANQAGLLDQEGQLRLQQLEVEGGQRLDQISREGDIQAERDRVNAGYNQELEQLRADNQAGLLDQEGQLRLEQLQTEGWIQARRDTMLQGFQMEALDQQQQNNVTNQSAEFAHQISQNRFQMASQFQAQYLDSTNQTMTNWSAEVAAVYSNPEMTSTQQNYAVAQIGKRYQTRLNDTADLYEAMGAWNVVTEQFPSIATDQGTEIPGTTPGTTPGTIPGTIPGTTQDDPDADKPAGGERPTDNEPYIQYW